MPAIRAGNFLGGRDALHDFTAITAAKQDGNSIRGLKIGTNVVGRGKTIGHDDCPGLGLYERDVKSGTRSYLSASELYPRIWRTSEINRFPERRSS